MLRLCWNHEVFARFPPRGKSIGRISRLLGGYLPPIRHAHLRLDYKPQPETLVANRRGRKILPRLPVRFERRSRQV